MKRRLGAITKRGNRYTRSLLVQAAWAILQRKDLDDPLCQWGLALIAKRGKRIAVIAVARRLVGILWAMWRDGTAYEARCLGTGNSNGLAKQPQSLDFRTKALARAARKRIQSSSLRSQAAT